MTTAALTVATLADWVGKEIGTSSWVTVSQERINAFAECTNDKQWIHIDVERAKRESPFGGPIAHGYLTLSLLADMSYEIGSVPKDAAAVFNYGLDKVRFLSPVKAGARVRARHLDCSDRSRRWPPAGQSQQQRRNRRRNQTGIDSRNLGRDS